MVLNIPSCVTAHLNRFVWPISQFTAYPPQLAPMAHTRLPSMNVYFLIAASRPIIRSVIGLSPQSPLISSMNFCPYPVEPRGLIMTTTYPFAANSCAFQRYDHESPQAPCGPPWIKNFTGYFLLASKFGGLT